MLRRLKIGFSFRFFELMGGSQRICLISRTPLRSGITTWHHPEQCTTAAGDYHGDFGLFDESPHAGSTERPQEAALSGNLTPTSRCVSSSDARLGPFRFTASLSSSYVPPQPPISSSTRTPSDFG